MSSVNSSPPSPPAFNPSSRCLPPTSKSTPSFKCFMFLFLQKKKHSSLFSKTQQITQHALCGLPTATISYSAQGMDYYVCSGEFPACSADGFFRWRMEQSTWNPNSHWVLERIRICQILLKDSPSPNILLGRTPKVSPPPLPACLPSSPPSTHPYTFNLFLSFIHKIIL